MSKRIIITGGSGLLGQYLNIAASGQNELLTVFNNHPGNCLNFSHRQANLRDRDLIKEIFSSINPEIVIHTAAFTNPVFLPVQDPKDIFDLNVNTTKLLAELCQKFGTKIIYISTDLVYAGYRGSMLNEEAKVIPVSLYAETKLMGEIKIKETFDNYLILRTALLYGIGLNHSRCHFHKMLENLKNGVSVNLLTDQYRTPISLNESARIILQFAVNNLKSETINLGGTERVSRFELGEILCNVAGFDKSLLIKSKLDDMPEFPKVEDVSLNTDKLKSLGLSTKSIEENILEIIRESSRY